MARKARRRYFPVRRNAGPTRPAEGERQAQLEAAAQQLASRHTLAELHTLLAERTALFEQADQAGTNDPSPANLARYRATRADWEVAQRAVELASVETTPQP